MDKQTSSLITALITQVAVPEILAFVREHHGQTGELPTNEQVIAKMNADADGVIQTGDAWLAAHS